MPKRLRGPTRRERGHHPRCPPLTAPGGELRGGPGAPGSGLGGQRHLPGSAPLHLTGSSPPPRPTRLHLIYLLPGPMLSTQAGPGSSPHELQGQGMQPPDRVTAPTQVAATECSACDRVAVLPSPLLFQWRLGSGPIPSSRKSTSYRQPCPPIRTGRDTFTSWSAPFVTNISQPEVGVRR